jgi:hypothetical protein
MIPSRCSLLSDLRLGRNFIWFTAPQSCSLFAEVAIPIDYAQGQLDVHNSRNRSLKKENLESSQSKGLVYEPE